jgi:Flp pilus assembly pilin Flp
MRNISLITRIRRRLKDRSGQSTTEYILILAIVVMIASKMKTKLTGTVGTAVDGVDKIIQGTVNEMGSE